MLNMIYVFELEDSEYFNDKTYVFCLFSSAMSPRSQKALKEGFWGLSFRSTTWLWDFLGQTHAHNHQIKVLTFPLPLQLLFCKLANKEDQSFYKLYVMGWRKVLRILVRF